MIRQRFIPCHSATALAFALSLVLVTSPNLALAGLYKWVDANGNVHFSDVPPPDHDPSTIEDLDGERSRDRERRGSSSTRRSSGQYVGTTPSRLLKFEKAVVDIPSPGDEPKIVGPSCNKRISVQTIKRTAERVGWKSGFHGKLEQLGFQTPGVATHFAGEAPPAADLLVMGVIIDAKISGCHEVTRLEVRWRIFDPLQRKVVLELDTQGRDVHFRHRDLRNSLLEAFVEASTGLARDPRFAELVSPDASPVASLGFQDESPEVERLRLDVAYGSGASTFSNRFPALKAGTVTIRTTSGHGSGFLLTPEGHVMTNDHVVGAHERLMVVVGDAEVRARVVRRDSARDVALLKVDGFIDALPLDLAQTPPREGETLFAIGTPLDERLKHTVTRGILSARRDIEGQSYYQTDAAVNPGNSGGPVLNEKGEVVAIAVSGLFSKGGAGLDINLLIPIHDAFDALTIDPESAGR